MFETHDNKLVKRALKGNQKSWFTLIDRYETAVFNYSMRMLSDREDAIDLVQDVFLSVYKSLHNFRGENDASFKSWLFRIAHFRCVEFYRKKHTFASLDEAPEPTSDESVLEVTAQMNKQHASLYKAMQTLSFEHKTVVELKFFGHFTFDEIAEQLCISTSTVKTRFYASLNKMRVFLEVENV